MAEAIRQIGQDRRRGEAGGRRLRATRRRRYRISRAASRRSRAAQRPRVYYGRGPQGLNTGLAGSINVESIEQLGAVNVAAEMGKGGLVQVSIEQVLRWNPDVVITIDPNFYAAARSHPLWGSVPAIKAGRIYLSPSLPYGWIDFPPSINRLIGPALARAHPVSSGVSRGPEAHRARFLHALLPPDADRGAARPVAANRAAGRSLMPARSAFALLGARRGHGRCWSLVAFSVGRFPVAPGDLASLLWAQLTGGESGLDPTIQTVVLKIRGPRVVGGARDRRGACGGGRGVPEHVPQSAGVAGHPGRLRRRGGRRGAGHLPVAQRDPDPEPRVRVRPRRGRPRLRHGQRRARPRSAAGAGAGRRGGRIAAGRVRGADEVPRRPVQPVAGHHVLAAGQHRLGEPCRRVVGAAA